MYRMILNETSYFGAGCRKTIAVEAMRRGFKKAFFVTDKDLIRFKVADKIIEVFEKNRIPYELFSDVKANPTIANVQNGVSAFKASGADFIVALGGGSSIDTAKGIGIVVNNPDFADVKSLEGVAATRHKAVPTFALPTTAGTAAEVTINYVIIDEDAKKKMVCVDPNDIPVVAIVDPELMYSMPKGLTAATGMDALTHAIESYITPGAWAMSDMFELKAIEMIAANLKAAVDDGNDVAAREAMSQAQYIAGMGFSNVGLGIVHSMAHPLGAHYDTPHGVANALLLPYVMEYNEELVKEAVYREMTRGGQVYYVYNRVNNIAEVTAELQRLLPDAKVAFAHGQMKERELEEIMMGFMNHEIDVLVSTTIIETGLDIPNVNTMIIHDANQLGLSQLYQLRGRVGRSNRNAFAFLMYKKNTLLKETAEKRLQAIREFTDLGSGYKIAMRDLEIRGAGNLLGQAQSGHMEAVGYDLYCKMLNEAVLRLKGELKDEDEFDTTLDLDINAFIPSTYVYNEYQKLELYKRISSIESKDEMEDMTDELIDRFGEMPKAVYNLLYVAYLKSLAHHAYMTDVKQKGEKVSFEMKPDAAVDVEKIPVVLEEYKRELSFQAGKNPTFVLDLSKTKKVKQLEKIEHCVNSLNSLIIQ